MSLFSNNTGNKQTKEECTRTWDYLQKSLSLPLNVETIKRAHKMMGKDGEYRKLPVFVGCLIFPLTDTISRLVDDVLRRYYHLTSRDPISAAGGLFIDLINIQLTLSNWNLYYSNLSIIRTNSKSPPIFLKKFL